MFELTNHKKLYTKLRDSWRIVTQLGFFNYKTYLVHQLSPNTKIYRSCYVCDYAKRHSQNDNNLCRYCPLEVDSCDKTGSMFSRILKSIEIGDRETYVRICDEVINSEVKAGVITT